VDESQETFVLQFAKISTARAQEMQKSVSGRRRVAGLVGNGIRKTTTIFVENSAGATPIAPQ
jgi:hypothetical protein